MESVQCFVRVEGELSDPFTTYKGLRQGDGLACLLFNFALKGAIRQSEIQVGGTIFNRTAQLLDIVGGTFAAMSEAFTSLEAAAARFGLEVTSQKLSTWRVMLQEEYPNAFKSTDTH
uniref:Reverse transcriptase domain-containing protein n=1 Tax=Lygus hesperus TaxID=30085 RepID=A0A0K8SVB3_LYGHE